MLVAARLVTEAQVGEALDKQKQRGRRLGEMLVELGYVTEAQMTEVLSNQLTLPWVNLYHVDFSRELLSLVSPEIAEKHGIVPIYVRHVRGQGDTLFVAMEDPLNLAALQDVADSSGMPVKPMVASPSDIRGAIRVYYLGLPPAAPEPEIEAGAIDFAEVVTTPLAAKPAPAAQPPVVQAAPEPAPEAAPEPGPTVKPSVEPAARPSLGFLTLTLLDGTEVRLPSRGGKKQVEKAERGLTTRDIIHALLAKKAGEDVSDVLPDDAVEGLLATLLSVLMRKGLLADWEFIDEWKKHRPQRTEKKR